MKKRILSLILAFTILCAFMPVTTNAYDSGTFYDLSRSLDDGRLIISGTGDMFDVIDPTSTPWYIDRSSITRIIIMGDVASIGNYAFYECTNLTSVRLYGGSLTSIGKYAFYCCTGLKSITIPGGVTSIGEGAFFGSGVTDITIPYTVTSIGDNALGAHIAIMYGCTGSFAETYAAQNSIYFNSIGVMPTTEPTATPTAEPTATPTTEPTATPTAEPTATPTAEPTATPTAEPTATPTAEPTATPAAEPTATPTAEPTAVPDDEACFVVSGNSVTNKSDMAQSATVIIANYNTNGALTGISSQKLIFTAGSGIIFDVPENGKIFVWDSLSGMRPLTK